MTSKLTRGPLFAEVHNVPDDYHFTAEELDRIIAGDLFTPRQGAIMARELQERRKAERDSEPVAWIVHARTGDQLTTDGGYVANAEGILGLHSTPLYRHAQQPVVPEVMYWQDAPVDGSTRAAAYATGWNACRAAMLQAGNSPVIPDGLIAAVNRLLDSDGSRGCYSAIRCHEARKELERLLAAAPQEVKP